MILLMPLAAVVAISAVTAPVAADDPVASVPAEVAACVQDGCVPPPPALRPGPPR